MKITPKYRLASDRCIVAQCRRKKLPGRICCAKHRQTKMRLCFSRLPVIRTPETIYVVEASTAPMKIRKGARCGEVKT